MASRRHSTTMDKLREYAQQRFAAPSSDDGDIEMVKMGDSSSVAPVSASPKVSTVSTSVSRASTISTPSFRSSVPVARTRVTRTKPTQEDAEFAASEALKAQYQDEYDEYVESQRAKGKEPATINEYVQRKTAEAKMEYAQLPKFYDTLVKADKLAQKHAQDPNNPDYMTTEQKVQYYTDDYLRWAEGKLGVPSGEFRTINDLAAHPRSSAIMSRQKWISHEAKKRKEGSDTRLTDPYVKATIEPEEGQPPVDVWERRPKETPAAVTEVVESAKVGTVPVEVTEPTGERVIVQAPPAVSTYDLNQMMQSGLTKQDLLDQGFVPYDAVMADYYYRINALIDPIRNPDGSFDIAKARAAGVSARMLMDIGLKPELERSLDGTPVTANWKPSPYYAEKQADSYALIAPYTDENGMVDLTGAIYGDKGTVVTPERLIAMGFSRDDVEAAATMAALRTYEVKPEEVEKYEVTIPSYVRSSTDRLTWNNWIGNEIKSAERRGLYYEDVVPQIEQMITLRFATGSIGTANYLIDIARREAEVLPHRPEAEASYDVAGALAAGAVTEEGLKKAGFDEGAILQATAMGELKGYDDPVAAVMAGVSAKTLIDAGYDADYATALVQLKPYLGEDGTIDVDQALADGVSRDVFTTVGIDTAGVEPSVGGVGVAVGDTSDILPLMERINTATNSKKVIREGEIPSAIQGLSFSADNWKDQVRDFEESYGGYADYYEDWASEVLKTYKPKGSPHIEDTTYEERISWLEGTPYESEATTIAALGGAYYEQREVESALRADESRRQKAKEQKALAEWAEENNLTPQLTEILVEQGVNKFNKTINELGDLKGEDSFNRQVELGIIPEGSLYVGEDESGLQYILPDQVDSYLASQEAREKYEEYLSTLTPEERQQIESEKYRIYDYDTGEFVVVTKDQYEAREKAYEQFPEAGPAPAVATMTLPEAVDKFEREHIQLMDGKWVTIDDWNSLPEEYQSIGIRRGYDAMVAAIEAEQKQHEELMSDLEPFQIPITTAAGAYHVITGGEGPLSLDDSYQQVISDRDVASVSELYSYDIAGALRKGIDPKRLEQVFPPEVVAEAQKFNEEMERAAKTEEAYHEQTWRNVLTGEVISDAEHSRLKGSEFDNYVKEQPALILPVDPKWQELKGRPITDPERQAYVRKWQDKAIDTATFVSLAAMPYTMGAIGSVGRLLTIPKVGSLAVRSIGAVWNPVVKSAIVLGKLANLWPVPVAASRVADDMRSTQLQADWQVFNSLPVEAKNEWADKAGYPADYNSLTDEQKAVTLTAYSKPPDATRDEWAAEVGEKIEDLSTYAGKGAAWLQQRVPMPVSTPIVFMGGVAAGVLEGMGYVASVPLMAGMLATSVPAGTAAQVANDLRRGMTDFFVVTLPQAFKANPALAAGRVTGLFLLSPKAIYKLGKSGLARFSPRYVPERAMAMEYSTVRIRFDKAGELAKLPAKERMALTEKAISELLSGKDSVKIKGATATITIGNVPYQKIVGNSLWHFTPDIRPFNTGKPVPLKGKLFASPQAAVRFGIATSQGKLGSHIGLVEIRVPDSYKPNMVKLLSRGEAELESVLGKSAVLDPIPSWSGKGISSNLKIGPYPIRRFTVLGTETAVTKLTPKKLLEVRIEASKAALGDLVKGWGGRKAALSKIVEVDPRTKRIDAALDTLKNPKSEVVASTGEIVVPRQSVIHPSGKGRIGPRVTAVVKNSKGEIMLVKDVTEQSFGLPGGKIDVHWRSGQLGFRRLPNGKRVLSPEGAAHGQVKSETGVGLDNTRYLDTYMGKVNEYALSGSRIFEANAKTDRFKLKKAEIQDAIWWDGKSDITVYPATYDILKGLAKKYNLDMSKVSIDRSVNVLNKARDRGIVSRLRGDKPLPKTIDPNRLNKIEIASLKKQKFDISRGRMPEVTDYLTAEGDLHTLAEIIHGRRKAVNIRLNKSLRSDIDAALIKVLKSDKTKVATKAKRLLAEGKTSEAARAYERSLPKDRLNRIYESVYKSRRAQAESLLGEVYDKYGNEIYRRDIYTERYAGYLPRYYGAYASDAPLSSIDAAYSPTVYEMRREYAAADVIRPYSVDVMGGRYAPRSYSEYQAAVYRSYGVRAPSAMRADTAVRSDRALEIPRLDTVVSGYRGITLPREGVPTPPRTPPPPPTTTTKIDIPVYEPPPDVPQRVPPRVPRVPPPEPPLRTPPPPQPPSDIPPPDVPPPEPPTRPPQKPPPEESDETVLVRMAAVGGESKRIPNGSIAWKQGLFWKYIPPPWNQRKPITLSRGTSPLGAQYAGSNSPYDTIQMIGRGGARVPSKISIDLGIADIFVMGNGKHIEYKGKGMETDVGTRIEGPAKGMSIPDSGTGGISRPEMGTVRPEHSVSRTAIAAGEVANTGRGKMRAEARRGAEDDEIAGSGFGATEGDIGVDRPEQKPELSEQAAKDEAALRRRGKSRPEATGEAYEYFDEDPNWLREATVMDRRTVSGKSAKSRVKIKGRKPKKRIGRDVPLDAQLAQMGDWP